MKMNKLRKQLYKSIEQYGLTDSRTIQLSQKLDIYVVKEQLKRGKSNESIIS
ncbi:aspartyl-phosphate phosphatase Spo0E family protein [Hathewaya histolytica]|uniref:aspartyl-phosphate phosphatase Spo0E family protein n=1 Tax=Hathewaya histolytica TaxID=1498 RepID=UPI001FAB028A|nr:aspartyl-phosphate phosphatase Spo0E family protein [Hathewaya histolytica]